MINNDEILQIRISKGKPEVIFNVIANFTLAREINRAEAKQNGLGCAFSIAGPEAAVTERISPGKA